MFSQNPNSIYPNLDAPVKTSPGVIVKHPVAVVPRQPVVINIKKELQEAAANLEKIKAEFIEINQAFEHNVFLKNLFATIQSCAHQ